MLENMYIVYSPIDNIQKLIEESEDLIVGTLVFLFPDPEHMIVDFLSNNTPLVCHIETFLKEEINKSKLEPGLKLDEIVIDEEDVGTWVFRFLEEGEDFNE
ncbi:MAG: hypothetical protein ACI4GW_11910 [Lachnospiraceae bacterium]